MYKQKENFKALVKGNSIDKIYQALQNGTRLYAWWTYEGLSVFFRWRTGVSLAVVVKGSISATPL